MTQPRRRPVSSFFARMEPHLAPRFGAAGSVSIALAHLRRQRAR